MLNNFEHISKLENVDYSIDEQNTQRLKIIHPDKLLIEITIPDGIFEWFVNIYDEHNVEVASDWFDHYDNSKEYLIKERRDSVEELVNRLLNHNLRVIYNKTLLRKRSFVEIWERDMWIGLMYKSKLRF